MLSDFTLADLDPRTHRALAALWMHEDEFDESFHSVVRKLFVGRYRYRLQQRAQELGAFRYARENRVWRNFSKLLKLTFQYCEICQQNGDSTLLDGHHVSYAHLGAEPLLASDVWVLCRPCHDAVHAFMESFHEH